MPHTLLYFLFPILLARQGQLLGYAEPGTKLTSVMQDGRRDRPKRPTDYRPGHQPCAWPPPPAGPPPLPPPAASSLNNTSSLAALIRSFFLRTTEGGAAALSATTFSVAGRSGLLPVVTPGGCA